MKKKAILTVVIASFAIVILGITLIVLNLTQKPSQAATPPDFVPVQISAGYSHSLAIDERGYIWAWRDNSSGQLGDGSTTTAGT